MTTEATIIAGKARKESALWDLPADRISPFSPPHLRIMKYPSFFNPAIYRGLQLPQDLEMIAPPQPNQNSFSYCLRGERELSGLELIEILQNGPYSVVRRGEMGKLKPADIIVYVRGEENNFPVHAAKWTGRDDKVMYRCGHLKGMGGPVIIGRIGRVMPDWLAGEKPYQIKFLVYRPK